MVVSGLWWAGSQVGAGVTGGGGAAVKRSALRGQPSEVTNHLSELIAYTSQTYSCGGCSAHSHADAAVTVDDTFSFSSSFWC